MAQIINTNISALNAQRNLSKSQAAGMQAMQRLSSGLRINSAKDDAAGLAISDRMSSQITGQNQAVRNANDGISLVQTGDGALAEITNNLQRIRELAVQSSNVVNSAADRAAIDLEVQQRLAEIDRSASQTSFNGQKLLDGSLGTANFQIGANAGEAISVGLNTDVRIAGTGKIASTTSGALGAGATSGRITSGAVATADFSAAGSTDTAGNITFTASTFNFSAATTAVDGTSTALTVPGANFSTAGVAQVDGSAMQAAALVAHDFSGAGLAQFDITGGATGGTQHITLTTNMTSAADYVTAINAQLTSNGSNIRASLGTGANLDKLILTNTGSTAAVSITNSDVNATANNVANVVGSAGAAAVATTNATFSVDGVNITLNGNDASTAAVAAELTTKMQASALGASYSAAVTGGKLVITHAGSATAVAISNADANANAAGIVNSAGVAGAAAAAGNAATLNIGGTAVTLNSNYGSYAGLAGTIQAQLGGSYTVTNTAGAITVARTSVGASSTSVDITGASANATTAGLGNATGTAGTYATGNSNASFAVDGHTVTLNANYTDRNGVAAAIQSQLSAFGYTASNTANAITITKTGSLAAVNITGADTNATAAGFGIASGQTGTSGGSVALTDLTINGTSMAGNYTSVQALADKINSSVGGVYASLSGNALKLTSSSAIAMGGATDTVATGLSSQTANSGSLATANTLSVASSLDTIQRVDNALSTVSSLRSTFGAVQNRFESVISTLQSASENLTAARSRIQDADFAAESANMSRSQVLQQAGTAILAQANQSSQGVMALLR